MDLGTANTVIFRNDDIVMDAPSIVAIDNNTGKCIAIGQQAKLMHEHTNPGIKTIRPLRNGVIADFNAAEMMIKGFIKQVNNKKRSLSPRTSRLWSAFLPEAPRWRSGPCATPASMPEDVMSI